MKRPRRKSANLSEEARTLQYFRSRTSTQNHVVPFVGTYRDGAFTCIVLPRFIPFGVRGPDIDSTSKIVEIMRGFGGMKSVVVRLSRELVEAVAFLHRHRVAHLDIKPENLVFDADTQRLYLIDFDLAITCSSTDEKVRCSCGTPGWAAPEVGIDAENEKSLEGYNPFKADLWSCGKVLAWFAEQCRTEDYAFKQLAIKLSHMDPDRRPLLHERIDDVPDFWLLKSDQFFDSLGIKRSNSNSGEVRSHLKRTRSDHGLSPKFFRPPRSSNRIQRVHRLAKILPVPQHRRARTMEVGV